MSQVHEFMLLGFAEGIEAEQQSAIMEALDEHLSRCGGLISREYYRGADERWVEHVVWADQTDLEASAHLEEDPVVAALFACFDTTTVSYACCERIEPGAGSR